MTLGYLVGRQIAGMRSAKKEPIAYSYNGAMFSALPEWDRERYPYAVIQVPLFADHPTLYVYEERPHYTDEGWAVGLEFDSDGAYYWWDYSYASGEWVANREGNHVEGGSHSSDVLWTNFDLLDGSGNIFLAASDPIPMYKLLRYSYNGTLLSELPEWDKEAYPYAVILDLGEPNGLTLYCVNVKATYSTTLKSLNYSDRKWSTFRTHHYAITWVANAVDNELTGNVNIKGSLVWSNYDVLSREDGSVYLSASAPIPVYE